MFQSVITCACETELDCITPTPTPFLPPPLSVSFYLTPSPSLSLLFFVFENFCLIADGIWGLQQTCVCVCICVCVRERDYVCACACLKRREMEKACVEKKTKCCLLLSEEKNENENHFIMIDHSSFHLYERYLPHFFLENFEMKNRLFKVESGLIWIVETFSCFLKWEFKFKSSKLDDNTVFNARLPLWNFYWRKKCPFLRSARNFTNISDNEFF